MKKNLLQTITIIISILLIHLSSVHAQTNVSGTLTENTVWKIENSPYTLTGSVGIPDGITLTIDSGVSISGDFDLLVNGTLKANGQEGKEIVIDGTRVFFKSAILSNTDMDFLIFKNSAGVQLADEESHKQDNPKNSEVLTIKNSAFENNAYVKTKGYETNAKVTLKNCSFDNSLIKNFGNKTEEIECNGCKIKNSTINSESYLKWISFTGSSIHSSTFSTYSDLFITSSKVQNSIINGWGDGYEYGLDSSLFINTRIKMPAGHLDLSNSRLSLSDSAENHLDVGTANIKNCIFEGKNNIDAVVINGVSVFRPKNSKIINSYFEGYKDQLIIKDFDTLEIKNNNFLACKNFKIVNKSSHDIDASENYWNVFDSDSINSFLYDGNDDIYSGFINYSDSLVSPANTFPVAPPKKIFKGIKENGVYLAWNANTEANIDGYKIYYKSNYSEELILLKDTKTNSILLTNLDSITAITISDSLAISAYNQTADELNDLREGNESWTSEVITPFFTAEFFSASLCPNDSINLELTKNFGFKEDNQFVVQFLEKNKGSEVITNLDTIDNNISSFSIPVQGLFENGREYAIRIFSTEIGIHTEPFKLSYGQFHTLSFEASEVVCHNENYTIEYTGSTDGIISWDFKDANILSGSASGPYEITWNSSGKKSIYFSIDNNGCVKDTTIYLTVTPEPVSPELCMVTVDEETSKNMLIWNYDGENIEKFGIYRETNITDDFTLVDYIEAGNFNTFIDSQSDPEQVSNRYKITALDSCGAKTELSAYHKTIHLTINKGLNDSWNLIWDGYEGFAFGTYKIHKSVNGEDFELIKEVASNITSFTDKNIEGSEVAYQIEVVNPNSCGESSNGRILQYTSSKSNVSRISGVTGIKNQYLEKLITLSPNPTPNIIKIKLSDSLKGKYFLTALNGQEIQKGSFNKNFEIDLNNQKRGIYLLNLITDQGTITKKIVKE